MNVQLAIFQISEEQQHAVFVQLELMKILKKNEFPAQKDFTQIFLVQQNVLNVHLVIFQILEDQLHVLFVPMELMNIIKKNAFLVH